MRGFEDEIRIKGLKLYAYHGVFDDEKANGQYFAVDITITTDLRKAGGSDKLSDTISYADVCKTAVDTFTKESYDLIEKAAEAVAEEILLTYSRALSVAVEVYKPEAPIDEDFDNVSVYITRSWHKAYISVGSNIGDGPKQIEDAKAMLLKNSKIRFLREADLITTKPYGYTDQPDFTNGMWLLETLLSPEELLHELNTVEAALKRERVLHWGPRTIDLDVIYYDDFVISDENLVIPHIDMANREFVLVPLNEVDPYKRHPINGLTAKEMLAALNESAHS